MRRFLQRRRQLGQFQDEKKMYFRNLSNSCTGHVDLRNYFHVLTWKWTVALQTVLLARTARSYTYLGT